jgi:hypothetical protein
MAENKFDRFWKANQDAGNLVEMIASSKFGKYGTFAIDNADIILKISAIEKVDPALLALTWLNETTFRFYSEPNMNGQPDNFQRWDVGPMQTNVFWTLKDIEVNFYKSEGIDLKAALGTSKNLFDGNPLENIRLAARRLNAGGRAYMSFQLDEGLRYWEQLTPNEFATLPSREQSLRRAIAYPGPDARKGRLESYNQFAPFFRTFFQFYGSN